MKQIHLLTFGLGQIEIFGVISILIFVVVFFLILEGSEAKMTAE